MIKKILMRIACVVSMFAVVFAAVSFDASKVRASGDKFFIQQMSNDNVKMLVYFADFNGTTMGSDHYVTFPLNSWTSQIDFQSDAVNAIVSWANTHGFSGITPNDVLGYSPTGMSPIALSGLFSDLASKPTTLSGYGITDIKPTQYWHNGAAQTSWKHLTFSGTTTSGSAVFYLTDDGTVNGNALCSATPKYMNAAVNDSGNTFGLSYAVTNSNKTLTVTTNVRSFSATTILGIGVLGSSSLAAAANGTAINVAVDCN